MTILTIPIALIFLSIFGLGCVLVCWALDRSFPMHNSKDGRS